MTQSLFAQTTICHKKEWSKPSTIEFTSLDGGKCEGQFSLNQMKKKGWFVKDIKINTSGKGLDYIYYLTDVNPIAINKEQVANNMKLEKIDLHQTLLKISQVTDETAVINMGNLKIGQSGIIEHTYKDGNQIIVSSAYVM